MGTAFPREITPAICLQNDQYCVGWGVKLYSLTHAPPLDETFFAVQSMTVAIVVALFHILRQKGNMTRH